ncbi:tyrosine-type recombinase/integrase [Corynebacterium freiburgense]|uniref:tyrosine-type recombinase/integrase n=1 Tax=Corynebacterium freiburgense TaxID=556548 RepID=UPI0004159A5D|nr:tyrosine-type recombinase/integrase [Corynebacterium freiburgense]WJZ03568.1 Tyrosine recombinase XerC [Corynebacterium freiburgense]WJZ04005.1 tyrosine-type recombinase/integrase [Corynebacterium freiburgense]
MQRVLLEDCLRGWRKELAAAGRSDGTLGVRTSHTRRVLNSIGVPLHDVRRHHLISWLAQCKYAPETRRQVIISLRMFFAWLLAQNKISANPAESLPAVARPRKSPMPAADYQIIKAMQEAPAWVALAVEIMTTCGLRRFEVAKLRSLDVQAIGNLWTIHVIGKGGHSRYVPCPPHLAIKLTAKQGYVFPGGQNGHVSAGWLGKQISKYLPAGITSHKLRHRYASVAYRSHHDLRAVQQLLGHASVATTEAYTAVDPSSVIETASAAWRIEGG